MLRTYVCAVLLAVSGMLAAETRPAKPLAVASPMLHDYEDSPAVPHDYRYQPGDTVYLSFLLPGYHVVKQEEERKVDVEWRCEARDAKDVPLAPGQKGEVKVDLAQEDKEWVPKIRCQAVLPPTLGSGTYHFAVTAKDRLGNTEAKLDVPFQVEGKAIEPSETATARNVEFLRKEDDPAPLKVAAYRPGDTVWVRFDMTGFQHGPKNKYDIQYGLTMRNAEGKVLFSQPAAAGESQETFYPKRYTSAVFSLNLEKNILPGEYTVVITVRDLVANTTSEVPVTFRVE